MSWEIIDHVCRRCMGRVLRETGKGGQVTYRCSNCGCTGSSEPQSVCCCGMQTREIVRGGKVIQASKPLGVRCVANPKPTPAVPSEIIAVAETGS